jgi:GNAT superfamily N-acetyltransferase
MTERTIIPDISDSQTLELLELLHNRLRTQALAPGVTQFIESEYVWCDGDGIPRGCLSVWPNEDARFGKKWKRVPGSMATRPSWRPSGSKHSFSFVVRVHPGWRRRGIATKLYTAASRDWRLHEIEFTALGAKWIKSIESSAATTKSDSE